MKTARDVSKGKCNTVPGIHTGLAAAVGPDIATGNGLVDAHKAALLGKVRCLGPTTPITRMSGPVASIQPPVQSVQPVTPTLRSIAAVEPVREISAKQSLAASHRG